MRRIIYDYEGLMVRKILACKTSLLVLDVIDNKINLIRKKTGDRVIIHEFVKHSLTQLRHANEVNTDPAKFTNIRSAISHLDNLRMQYKTF